MSSREWRSFICPPQENVYHVPDTLSLKAAALCEPLACCLHGVDLLDVLPGQTVAIVDFGAIGSLMLQLCRRAGAGKVVVIETEESKRESAMKLGATLFLNPKTDDLKRAIADAGIECVEKVIECGGLPVTAQIALDVAGRGATVVLFGVGTADAIVPLRQYEAFQKELTIKTSYINPYTTDCAISLLANGCIDIDAAIERVIRPEELPEELETRRYSRLGKVIVCINEEK